MDAQTPDFTIAVEAVKGRCPAGERYALEQIAQRRTPVLACEGPCIRGEIARLAANLVAAQGPGLARACHAEAFFVPHSAMSQWVRGAERSVMIDGCFLQCHGRVLRQLTAPQRVIHFDAFRLHRKYADVFSMDDVPEAQRRETAREVADAVLGELSKTEPSAALPGT
ncbi:MAG: putative zinc-binding protein [Ramlibacter sp.]|nr:putative zinc-binding protein [Ramlibacter sp.]